MSQIDWSKAPEGTTHFDQGSESRISGWMRLRDGKWYWWPAPGAKCARDWHLTLNRQPVELFIERPAQWAGEGLPPVGEICERNSESGEWVSTKILAHSHLGSVVAYEDVFSPYHLGWCNRESDFRPIRTPEQISAEARDKAIQQMIEDTNILTGIMSDRKIMAGQLYDTDWRKFEIVDNEE